MNRNQAYPNHLTETGDLIRQKVTLDSHAQMIKKHDAENKTVTAPYSTTFPPPPPPEELLASNQPQLNAVQKEPTSAPVSAKQSNGHVPVSETDEAKKVTTSHALMTTPPLRIYADVDVKALEKNPIHNDIMNAAEKFKGRRELYSDDGLNPSQNEDLVVKDLNGSEEHPVYDPEKMRTSKEQQPIAVNSDARWSRAKPFVKRNTFTVVPKSQTATFIANAQHAAKTQPHRTPEQYGYAKLEDIPEADALLDRIATHDDNGNVIPEWKRKLMAHSYRVKLCEQFKP